MGIASPCNFSHEARDINLTVHGDDFLVAGSREDCNWLREKMKKKYELKFNMLGPEGDCDKEIRILNRVIRWTKYGIEYESDQRHADTIVDELDLGNAKPVSTPGVTELKEAGNGSSVEELTGSQVTKFRSIAARLNFLALDRADIQYAAKCICKYMSKPTQGSWDLLKRAGRYLKGTPRVVQQFPWTKADGSVYGFADSDWAGDRKDAKSTSGGVLQWAGHTLKTWSSSQSTIALSSGEAELYALTKCAAQTVGMISIARDFGILLNGLVTTDSTAAMGIVHREGLGRTRHIQCQYLWLQEKTKDKSIIMEKVSTKENPADLMTKHLCVDTKNEHMARLKMVATSGKAGIGLTINSVLKDTIKVKKQAPSDFWINGDMWRRRHNKLRSTLFTPLKVSKGPSNPSDVGCLRVIVGTTRTGKPFEHKDFWKSSTNLHMRVEPFRGETIFMKGFSDNGQSTEALRPWGGDENTPIYMMHV